MAIDQIPSGLIKDNAVTTVKILDDNITAAKIVAGAVVADIANGGVATAKLADDAVTAAKLGAGAVDATALGTNAVTTVKINADAIDGTKIANDAVNSEHVAAGAIDTAHVGNDQITGAKIENNPTIGGNLSVVGTTFITGDFVPASALSHRNMIINGAMNVAQRTTSNLNTGGAGYSTLDRFRWTSGDYTDNFDFTQSTVTGVPGIIKAYKVVNDVDEGSVPAAHIVGVQYKVEAQDFIRVRNAAGTGTVPFTLSFYAKVSTGTGTYSVYLDLPDTSSSANSRYTSSFTVSNANWNRYEINVPANSVGVVNNDNGIGLDINWLLIAGSDFTGGTTGAWAVSSSNNNKKVSGQTQLWSGATGRSFELTGVQLELGNNATPFEHRSFGEELARCQRYYVKSLIGYSGCKQNGTAYLTTSYDLPVTLRADPTIGPSTGSVARGTYNAWQAITSWTPGQNAREGQHIVINWNGFSGGNDNRSAIIASNNVMTLDCEL